MKMCAGDGGRQFADMWRRASRRYVAVSGTGRVWLDNARPAFPFSSVVSGVNIFPGWTRRRFIAGCGAAVLSAEGWLRAAGRAEPPLASFDREMEAFMAARKIPGGALAVVKNRRLVYARGYGWADREKKIPAHVGSLFRIASISKPFTAVAVLKLVEEGRLQLSDHAFPILRLTPIPAAGKTADARLQTITILQLLQHTAGWDRDRSGDPMFRSKEISMAAGLPGPADAGTIIRFMLGQPLDFAPGARHVYANFGYGVLGRIIEKVSGLGYEQFVREKILKPSGITRMRIGATLDGQQAVGEVRYYTPDEATGASVFPGAARVPQPYGCWHLEAMEAHGGWIASAVDLARFAAALDDPARSPLLKPEIIAKMYAPPTAPVARRPDGKIADAYYGCGWMVRPVGTGGKANYWHNGSLPGTNTLLVRRSDGLSWAALFNQRSEDKKLPDGEIDAALHRAANAVREWPRENLFPGLAGQ